VYLAAMSFGESTPRRPSPWDDPRLVFPDEATWAGLDEAARARVIERIVGALDEYQEVMSEGTRHVRRKVGIGGDLDAHFRRAGRGVYLGMELAVFYPGEPVIVPDVCAVMDCDPDIEPESWVVQDQGRGIDVIFEVRNLGKKHKDLVDNVRDYARRRVPEYFSFDCRRGQLRGWRLAQTGAQSYVPIVPQGGMLPSKVLGLELGVVGTRLRFFANQAMIPSESELVARLQHLADEQQSRLDDTSRRLDDTSRRLEDVVGQLAAAQIAMANGVLALCDARGVSLSDAHRARVVAEDDVATLARWLSRAGSAAQGDEVFAG
jgi:Uma2 family endonuclease